MSPRGTKARINSNDSNKIVSIYSLLLRSLLPRRRIGTSTTLASASASTSTSVSLSTPCAKALLSLPDVGSLLAAYKETLQKNLSVRQVEELVRSFEAKPKKNAPVANNSKPLPLTVKKMQDQLTSALSTKVNINRTGDGKGEIVVKFYNDDDLERLVESITGA